jgi:DEAD/DEAH box helicase domain-containing protein
MRKIFFDIETDGLIVNQGSKQVFPNIYVVSIYDSGTDEYLTFEVSELKDLWPRLEKADLIVGYNNFGFDTPVLNRYYSGDLKSIQAVDILEEIRKSLGRRIKLDAVAEATLGRKKIANGLEAMTWWKQGLKDKVKEYCVEDVKITKEVYDFAFKNGYLKYKDKETGEIKELKLNTTDWEKKSDSAITHTLFG